MSSVEEKHDTSSSSDGESSSDHSLPNQPTNENIVEDSLSDSSSSDEVAVATLEPITKKKEEQPKKDEPVDEKKKKEEVVGLFQLFRFAEGLDIFLMIVGSIFAIAFGCVMPLMTLIFGELVNALNATNDKIRDEINKVALWFVYLAIAAFVAAFGQNACWMIAAQRQITSLRSTYLRRVLNQEIGWFDGIKSGELTTRIAGDTILVHDAIGDKFAALIQHMATFVCGFVIGFVRGWKLTLVIMSITPLMAAAGAFVMKLMTSFTSKGQKAYAEAGDVATEVISSVRTVASFTGEEREVERYGVRLQQATKVGIKKGFLAGAGMGVTFFLFYGAYALALWYGGILVVDENYDGGKVINVFLAVIFGAFSLGQAGPSFENISKGRGAAFHLLQTIDRKPLIASPGAAEEEKKSKKKKNEKSETIHPDAQKLMDKGIQGDIDIDNVHFHYPTRPDAKILRGISLKIKAGRKVALVGKSGCGKSSTIGLLLRFYDPVEGTVKVDDVEIKHLNLKFWRQNVGIVSQEPVLFSGTIAENISYGKENATMEEIIEASQSANAHNFISQFPEGYNTQVGERGAQLSGGQKQRIAIARAIVKNPKILLLDEATSALDTESEKVVQDALDKVMTGRTTIVIAHRLATIRDVDEIVVISEGTVAERGTYDSLYEQKGMFYELVQAQLTGEEKQRKKQEKKLKKQGINLTTSMSASGNPGMESGHLLQSENGNFPESSIPVTILPESEVVAEKSLDLSNNHLEKSTSKKGKKGKKEKKPKEESVPLRRLLELNRPEYPLMILGSIAAIINGCIQPVFSILFSRMLAVYYKPKDEVKEGTHLWAGLFLMMGGVALFANTFQASLFGAAGEKLCARARKRSFAAILRHPISWFDDSSNSTGILTSRLASDTALLEGLVGGRLGLSAQNISTLICAFVISFTYGWKLTLVIISCMPLMIFANAIYMLTMKGFQSKSQKAAASSNEIATEALGNIRTVVAFAHEEAVMANFVKNEQRPLRIGIITGSFSAFLLGLGQCVMFLSQALGFWYGGKLIHDGEMTFVDVMTAFMSIFFGAMSIGQASAMAPNGTKAKAAATEIFKLLDYQSPIDPSSKEGETLETVRGDIEFTNVEFAYPTRKEAKVFRSMNISVKSGQIIALVGASGSGKSSTIALLERFYDPSAGQVKLDGHDISKMNVAWLRKQFSLVGQEPVLFSGTIADNIAYGKEGASLEEIQEAAKASNAHNFISEFPDGYNTQVGERGAQLSGGQKQRIAIARAIIKNPKVLLLDEATSALDTESEAVVQEALDKVMKGRTTIVVSHRLSTIRDADLIAVVHKGKIGELGNHTELMQKKKLYYNLVQRQTQ